MEIHFKNAYLEKLFEGRAVPGKPRYSDEVVVKFKKTIQKLQFVDSFGELARHKGLNFESLKGDFKGYFSVRVDKSYRLILTKDKVGTVRILEVLTVHDLNNHYR